MWKKIFDEKIPGRLFGPADPKELSILFINMQETLSKPLWDAI
jgi:hypothetical protein